MAIYETLYPQGNFLDIRANAPTQADYNIRATEDLVNNLPGGLLKDIISPAAAATLSLPYDVIQAISRADSYTPSGIMKAIDAENPLSSAYERFVGASAPLAERISNMFSMGQAEASDLGEIANLQSILNPVTPELMPERKSSFGGPFRPDLNEPYRYVMELMPDPDFPQFAETDTGATGTVPTLKEGILSQVDSRFPLYDDFTVAEEGDDLEDNAVTVDELGNLKQPSGFKDFLKTMLGFAIPGANLFMGDRSGLEGIKSLNQRLRNTDFGRSKTLADYFDARRYGGRDARDAAAARTMAQARGLQKQIDQRPSAIGGGGGGGGRDMGASVSSPARTSQGVTSAQHSAFRN